MEHIIWKLRSDFPQRMPEDQLLREVGVGAYVVTVLVSELAVMLTKEDMKVDDDETARQILQKSAGLGETLHEDV
jgi:RTC4-like domain